MGGSRARVELLGPLRVLVDGAPVEVPGPKRRAVLALLALAEGETVPVDRLVDALWPSDLPDSARPAVHSHVSRLRAHLGPAAALLQTRPDGYRLHLRPADLDVAQARALLADARALAARDPAAAAARLRTARALWRGPVLADLAEVAPIAVAVEGCAQLHREVTEALVACAVDAGQADEVVGLARAAHAADPLREPGVLALVRTLAAAGRAPEALRVGREYRLRLAEETGLDPSPALGELERAVAAGPPSPPRVGTFDTASRHVRHRESALPAPPPGPRAATPLIGRAPEVAALHRLLAEQRLVTVVGPRGVGKTRLADEVAGGAAVTVLLLAPVTDPAAVPYALAAALDLTVGQGDVLAACLSALGERPGLLVVDNCEHLPDAARDLVDAVLTACPRLAVLATSREPLGLGVEFTFRLGPLPLPGAGDDADQPAVAVFLHRARRVRRGPPPTPGDLRLVADIVRRLDGIPLAIELAAGRLTTFSLADLHARLDRALDLLGGRPGGAARHRTLRATVDWSYRLLGDDEQRLFRHLAVFVDGVDLDTAETVAAALGLCGDPGTALAGLVDASMVTVAFGAGATRYRMLETVRAFGLDRLTAAGEQDEAGARLVRWAVDLTARIGADLTTEREPDADALLRRELPNLRVAWRQARRSDPDAAAAIVVALFDAIAYRDLVEVRGWAGELADRLVGDPAHPWAAAVLGTAGEAAYHDGDLRRADELARLGLERAPDARTAWYCLAPLTVAALARGEFAAVVERATGAGFAARRSEGLVMAALALAYAGDPDRARVTGAAGLAAATSPTMRAWHAYVAGEIETRAGDGDAAERHYRAALAEARRSGATFLVGVAAVGLQSVLARSGRTRDALHGFSGVVDQFARTGNWTHLWTALRNLADLLRRLGDHDAAALLDAAADRDPDAPAAGPSQRPASDGARVDRAEVLAVARDAIARHLGRG